MKPLEFGSYENEEMLYVLSKAGAKVTVENNDRETPLQMALKNGISLLAKRLQSLIPGDPEVDVVR